MLVEPAQEPGVIVAVRCASGPIVLPGLLDEAAHQLLRPVKRLGGRVGQMDGKDGDEAVESAGGHRFALFLPAILGAQSLLALLPVGEVGIQKALEHVAVVWGQQVC